MTARPGECKGWCPTCVLVLSVLALRVGISREAVASGGIQRIAGQNVALSLRTCDAVSPPSHCTLSVGDGAFTTIGIQGLFVVQGLPPCWQKGGQHSSWRSPAVAQAPDLQREGGLGLLCPGAPGGPPAVEGGPSAEPPGTHASAHMPQAHQTVPRLGMQRSQASTLISKHSKATGLPRPVERSSQQSAVEGNQKAKQEGNPGWVLE